MGEFETMRSSIKLWTTAFSPESFLNRADMAESDSELALTVCPITKFATWFQHLVNGESDGKPLQGCRMLCWDGMEGMAIG